MSDVVIKSEGLGKRYRIGERERYLALRDLLARTLTTPFRRNGHRRSTEDMWALRDVSFDVKQGEVVGLIGRNGAGKTTLLKILSRITRPTTGYAEIRGRVGSLLEVGTGFHPELTGRENVYLSGAILGMGKSEINRKFDEIVAFAGVDRFIDTPLKHFSTGMQMRLAFAVAAHLEPEILLVDEVLAVGDIEFQKKCLGKMQDVSKSGRTIVFVSHQMNQIRRLCERVVWVDDGRIHKSGPAAVVLGEFETALNAGRSNKDGRTNGARTKARFGAWTIGEAPPNLPNMLTTLGKVSIRFAVEILSTVRLGQHGVALFNSERQLMWAWSKDHIKLEPGLVEFRYTFPTLPLRPGSYSWQVSLWENGEVIDLWDCVPEMIIATEVHQHARDEWNGILNVPCQFTVDRSS
jgi:ABC-type polysaccharide/polyol phosphate transport system ATPase subunit